MPKVYVRTQKHLTQKQLLKSLWQTTDISDDKELAIGVCGADGELTADGRQLFRHQQKSHSVFEVLLILYLKVTLAEKMERRETDTCSVFFYLFHFLFTWSIGHAESEKPMSWRI